MGYVSRMELDPMQWRNVTQHSTMVTHSRGLRGRPKLSQTVQMLVGTLQQWVTKEAILVTLLPLSKAAQVGHAMASMRLSCKGTCNIASGTKMQRVERKLQGHPTSSGQEC